MIQTTLAGANTKKRQAKKKQAKKRQTNQLLDTPPHQLKHFTPRSPVKQPLSAAEQLETKPLAHQHAPVAPLPGVHAVPQPVLPQPVAPQPQQQHDPCLADGNSRYYWKDTTSDDIRQRYFRCTRHGTYVCPDCLVHVADWAAFAHQHYGCSAFITQMTKQQACTRCTT